MTNDEQDGGREAARSAAKTGDASQVVSKCREAARADDEFSKDFLEGIADLAILGRRSQSLTELGEELG